jgi:hypothetical protein
VASGDGEERTLNGWLSGVPKSCCQPLRLDKGVRGLGVLRFEKPRSAEPGTPTATACRDRDTIVFRRSDFHFDYSIDSVDCLVFYGTRAEMIVRSKNHVSFIEERLVMAIMIAFAQYSPR